MQSILAPWGGITSNEYAKAAAGALGAGLGALGQFGGALGTAGAGYMQGLGAQGANYANAYGAYAGGINGINDAIARNYGSLNAGLASGNNVYGQNFAAYTQGLGGLGQSAAQAFGYLGQGLGNLGQSYANAYGGMAGGLGEVAKAMSQERSGYYNANAIAEAARQASLGSIGASALNAYGGAANSALGAWAQNQRAYNDSLAALGSANQGALAQLGSSRNAALGQMGSAYSDLGGRLGAASVIGDIDFNFNDSGMGGGGGFNATGPSGTIASGSFGGGGMGGMNATGSRRSDTSRLEDIAAPAYSGLAGLQNNLMAGDILGQANASYNDSMSRLDRQHYSSRNTPSDMLNQALGGILQLGQDGYSQMRGGMNQFYGTQNDPANRANYSGVLGMLNAGYADAARNLNTTRNDMLGGYGGALAMLPQLGSQMRSAFGDTNRNVRRGMDDMISGYRDANTMVQGNLKPLQEGFDKTNTNIGGVIGSLDQGWGSISKAIRDLWDSSVPRFMPTPLEQAKMQREADVFNRNAQLADNAWRWQHSPLNNSFSQGKSNYYQQQLATAPN